MKIKVDLHIHSDLSPCAHELMTPGNIVGIALLNGLDAIAITDHNCVLNVEAAIKIGQALGVLVIPGMELETVEEIHVICLFPDIERSVRFYDSIKETYSPVKNKVEIFGQQHIYNEDDEIVGEWEPLLITPTGVSIDDVFALAESFDGVAYPAHVDRDSYSVLTTLGAMPYGYEGLFAEISTDCDKEVLYKQFPFMKEYELIVASDAHALENLPEEGFELDVEEKTVESIIRSLKRKK